MNNYRHRYTPIEDAFLINNVKGITLEELTNRFNKEFNYNLSKKSIANRKNKLKIKSGIVGGQFQKGQVPFNKGKKWNDYMTKRGREHSKKTQFQKGNIPWATKPIGTERLDAKDHYVYVKKANPSKWQLKQRYLYEQNYGKIPEGYNVIFADGDKYNFDLDNLILVSNAELLIMNKKGLHKNDKELTRTGSLIAKVINKTNKLKNNII